MSRNQKGERMGGREKKRTDQIDVPADWESDFYSHQSSLEQTRMGYMQCAWHVTGAWRAQAWPTGGSPPPKKGTPSKKKVEERGQISCCPSEFSKA